MPDENEGFTVRDRRRFVAEETAETAATPAAAPEVPFPSPPADELTDDEASAFFAAEDAVEGMPEDQGLPDVYSVLALFMGELRHLAWLRMGLVANPSTGRIERDMEQAKIAIDTVAFLASQIEGVVEPDERLPLKAMVSDLQINYVEQSKRG